MFIAANCTNLLGQINSTGVVRVKSISAAHALSRLLVLIRQLESDTGARHEVGGDTFVVQLRSDERRKRKEGKTNALSSRGPCDNGTQGRHAVSLQRSGEGSQEVSAGEYGLHLILHGKTQVTWQR